MLWEISEGEGLNRLRKFTGQVICSHIHSKVFLGNGAAFGTVYIRVHAIRIPYGSMCPFIS
jgi:hypothetical protein